MATKNFKKKKKKLKKVATMHPSPSDFPTPGVRWYPHFFFIKMIAKDVKEITLPICPRSLSSAFWNDQEKNRKGLQPPLPG